MGRRVVWGKIALQAYYKQAFWYKTNEGEQFVQSFVRNVHETINQIAAMPTIGRLERKGMENYIVHFRLIPNAESIIGMMKKSCMLQVCVLP